MLEQTTQEDWFKELFPKPKEGFLLPDPIFEKNLLEIDGKRSKYMLDGDTLKDVITGERIRIPGYDSPEVGYINEDLVSVGEVGGDLQTKFINKIIEEGGFNRLVDTGRKSVKKGDDRPLMDLVNEQGVALSDYLHKERVEKESRWMTSNQHMLRNYGEVQDHVSGVYDNATPGDKARGLLGAIIGAHETPYIRDVFGTESAVLGGSGFEKAFLESEINRISNLIRSETDETKRSELENELLRTQDALLASVNTIPSALNLEPEYMGYNNKSGYWGETVNSGWQSLYILESSAANGTQWIGDLLESDTIENWGEDWVLENEERMRKVSNTTGLWDVRNPYDALRFTTNSIVQYTPQLGTIAAAGYVGGAIGSVVPIVGTAAGAAAGMFGASFIMAVGDYYGNMKEKDPVEAGLFAIPIAALDKLGVTKVTSPIGTPGFNMFTKDGRQIVKNQIKKNKGVSDEVAGKMLDRATMEVLHAANMTLKDAVRSKIIARSALKDLGMELLKRAGWEGATEAMQEFTKEVGYKFYPTVTGNRLPQEIDPEQLFYAMTESFAIGSIVGGAYSTPGLIRRHHDYQRFFWENMPIEEQAETRLLESEVEEHFRNQKEGKKLGKPERKEFQPISLDKESYDQLNRREKRLVKLANDLMNASNNSKTKKITGLINKLERQGKGSDAMLFEFIIDSRRDRDINLRMKGKGSTWKPSTTDIVKKIVSDIGSRMAGGTATGQRPRPSLSRLVKEGPESNTYLELLATMKNKKRLVQSYRNFVKDFIKKRDGSINENISVLANILGAVRTFSGVDIPSDQKILASDFLHILPSKKEIMDMLGTNDPSEIYQILNQDINTITDPVLKENILKLTKPARYDSNGNLVEQGGLLATLGKLMVNEITSRGVARKLQDYSPNLYVPLAELDSGAYFLNPNYLDPRKVDARFKELLAELDGYIGREYDSNPGGMIKFSPERIEEIYRQIKDGYLPNEQRMRLADAGVFNTRDNPEFKKYISNDFYESMQYTVDSLARDTAMLSKVGIDGEVIAELLERAQAKGEITQEDKLFLARMTQDYLDMVKGNYRNIKNPALRWFQENLLFGSVLVFMDLNLIANSVETVNTTIGLNNKQIWNYMKGVTKNFFKYLNTDIKAAANVATLKKLNLETDKAAVKTPETEALKSIGAMKSDVAFLESANTNSKQYRIMTNVMYRINQVENHTLSIRGGRAAAAWESMIKLIMSIQNDNELGYTTAAGRWSRDLLNYYGVDPDTMLAMIEKLGDSNLDFAEQAPTLEDMQKVLGKEETSWLMKQYQIGATNFTDEFAIRPQPGTSQRIMEDPRWRLFTQYKRFITTFMAQIIPHTWEYYIRRGPPGMGYRTFNTIMGAVLMGYLAMAFKDWLVWGGEPPWLEDDDEDPDFTKERWWRALNYSGWIGSSGMLVEAIMRHWENTKNDRRNPFENLYDNIASQSPPISKLSKEIFKRGSPFSGEFRSTDDLASRMAKNTPYFGDIKPVREELTELYEGIGDFISK